MLNPIRHPKSTVPLLAATAILLGMSGCLSNDQRTSNLQDSNDDSAVAMNKRLQSSSRVNQIASKLELALRPVANILADIEKILKADEQLLIRDKIAHIRKLSISVVREELGKLKTGLVNADARGGWSVEGNVQWPFDRTGIPGLTPEMCAQSTVSLIGESVTERSESVRLDLADCAIHTTLLSASVTYNLKNILDADHLRPVDDLRDLGDIDVDAEMNLGDLEAMLKPGASRGACSIKARGNDTVLECAPFREISGDVSFDFERVSYWKSQMGETLDFSMLIVAKGENGKNYSVRATVQKKIGQKTKVEVKRL